MIALSGKSVYGGMGIGGWWCGLRNRLRLLLNHEVPSPPNPEPKGSVLLFEAHTTVCGIS
jgi:hypothetical protein